MKTVRTLLIIFGALFFVALAAVPAVTLNIGKIIPSDGDNSLEVGLTNLFAFLFTVIPIFCCIPLGIAFLASYLCYAIKKNFASAVAMLVIECILVVILGYTDAILLIMVAPYSLPMAAVYAGSAVLLAATFVINCIAVSLMRKQRKEEAQNGFYYIPPQAQ